MAKRKITATTAGQKKAQQDEFTVDINEVQETATEFWERNGRMISLVGGGLALILGLFSLVMLQAALILTVLSPLLFDRSNLSGVDFSGADLKSATFKDSVLRGAIYSKSTQLPFSESKAKSLGMVKR